MVVANQNQVDNLINVNGQRLTINQYILDVENMLVTNVKDAMLKLGANVVKNLEKYSPDDSGKLKSSYEVLGVSDTKDGYRIEIGIGVNYADFLDKGVRGIKHEIKKKKVFLNDKNEYYQFRKYGMPLEALKQLEGWMRRKNMEIEATNLRIASGDSSLEGRSMLPQISSSAKRFAYYIKKYGIEGRQFIKQSVDIAIPDFNIDVQSIGRDSLILRISK
jgi:hypothetical protein